MTVVLPGYNWILQGDPVSGKELQCGQGSLGLDVALPVIWSQALRWILRCDWEIQQAKKTSTDLEILL